MFRVHYLCSEALLTLPPIPGSSLGRNRGSFPKHKSYYHSTCIFLVTFSSFRPAGYIYIYTSLPLAFLHDNIAIALVTKLQFHVIKKTSDLDWQAVCPQQSCSVQQCCQQLLPDTLLRCVWPPLMCYCNNPFKCNTRCYSRKNTNFVPHMSISCIAHARACTRSS